MKKILTGCLIVAVIAMVGLGVAMFYAYRMAKPMIDSAASYMAAANEVARLGDLVANKKPYIPPDNDALTAAQVDRFMAVQGRVHDELKDRWKEIETRSAEFREKTKDGQRDLTLTELRDMITALGSVYIEGRRVQVNALNIHKFSDGEYAWVRRRVYEAAGVQLAGSLDMSKLEDLARQGAQKSNLELPDLPPVKVPEANIQLVKPHLARLKEWMPMAVLGL